jgi:predicted DNA repair protein MutK
LTVSGNALIQNNLEKVYHEWEVKARNSSHHKRKNKGKRQKNSKEKLTNAVNRHIISK